MGLVWKLGCMPGSLQSVWVFAKLLSTLCPVRMGPQPSTGHKSGNSTFAPQSWPLQKYSSYVASNKKRDKSICILVSGLLALLLIEKQDQVYVQKKGFLSSCPFFFSVCSLSGFPPTWRKLCTYAAKSYQDSTGLEILVSTLLVATKHAHAYAFIFLMFPGVGDDYIESIQAVRMSSPETMWSLRLLM